ncbi:TonB-dependent receptor [Aliiglaciecola sp. NS0011-25]|uniref:TonB-dependent receptor n=1 Tax=Aliiglaciecola sp. NS0011-25 TaxID=3127654 RepID=UPI00310A69F8
MKKSKLAIGIIAAITSSLTSVASAQSTDNEGDSKSKSIEVITVSGVRVSERQSIYTKREADTFVEVVTAADIGELPERGIAEALEQLPGVVGNQDRGRSNTVAVRGLGGDFTLTTINGREVASSFGSRSVNLNLYPAEAVRKAMVMKTPMANQIEGGIGGTVEMQTLRPLNVNSNIRTISARGIYNEGSKDVEGQDEYGYRASGMFSEKLLDDTFGVALGLSVLSDPQVNNRFTVGDYNANKDYNGDGIKDPAPGFMAANPQYRDEERIAVFGSLQWQPNDSADITFDALYSKFEFENTIPGLSYIDFNNGPFKPEDAVVDSVTGDVTSALRSKARLRSISAQSTNLDETLNLGLNGRFFTYDWVVDADLAYSEAERQFDVINVKALDNVANNPIQYDFYGDTLPNITIGGGEYDALEPSQFRVQEGNDNRTSGSDKILSARLDFSRDIELGAFEGLEFGIRYANRKKESKADKEAYKLAWPQQFYLTEEMVSQFPLNNAYGDLNSDLPGSWAYIKPQDGLALIGDVLGGLPEREITLADQQGSFETEEETISLYGQLNFATDIGEMLFTGNVGVRVVETDLTSNGVRGEAKMVDTDGDGEADAIIFDESSLVAYSDSDSYTNVLPTFNGLLTIQNDLLVRMAAGKAITRANFNDMSASLKLSEIDDLSEPLGTGSGGNPNLKPIESTQGDIALEWYPNKGAIYSIGYFYKNFDSAYGPGIVTQNVNDLSFDVKTTIQNNEGGTIKGVELSMRQEFDFLPGLLKHTGMSANYTKMDNDVLVDYNTKDDVENLQYAEMAVDNTWNTSLFYDDNTLSARVNYGYQAEQVQHEGGNYRVKRPTYLLSASINYKVNKHLSLVLQGSNLTDEVIEFGQIGKFEEQASINRLSRVESSGRRIYLGLRAKF